MLYGTPGRLLEIFQGLRNRHGRLRNGVPSRILQFLEAATHNRRCARAGVGDDAREFVRVVHYRLRKGKCLGIDGLGGAFRRLLDLGSEFPTLRRDGRNEAAARLVQQVRQVGGARLHDIGCRLSARFDLPGHIAAALQQLAERLGGMFVDLLRRVADPERDLVGGRDGSRLHVLGGAGEPCGRKLGRGVGARFDRLGRFADQYGGSLDRRAGARPHLMGDAVDRRLAPRFDVSGNRLGAADQQFLEPADLAFEVIGDR